MSERSQNADPLGCPRTRCARQRRFHRRGQPAAAWLLAGATLLAGCSNLNLSSRLLPFKSKANDMESKLAYARLCERHGQQDQAAEMYQGVIKQDQRQQVAYQRLGVLAGKRGQYQEANDYFDRAMQLAPPTAELYNDIGYNYFLQDRLDDAEQSFREALKRNPQYASAHNNLGLVYGQLGRYEDSLVEFRKAGSDANAYANLAYVYAQNRELGQSEKYFSRALDSDPSLRTAAEGLVQVAGKDGRLRSSGRTRRPAEPEPDARSAPPSLVQRATIEEATIEDVVASRAVERRPSAALRATAAAVAPKAIEPKQAVDNPASAAPVAPQAVEPKLAVANQATAATVAPQAVELTQPAATAPKAEEPKPPAANQAAAAAPKAVERRPSATNRATAATAPKAVEPKPPAANQAAVIAPTAKSTAQGTAKPPTVVAAAQRQDKTDPWVIPSPVLTSEDKAAMNSARSGSKIHPIPSVLPQNIEPYSWRTPAEHKPDEKDARQVAGTTEAATPVKPVTQSPADVVTISDLPTKRLSSRRRPESDEPVATATATVGTAEVAPAAEQAILHRRQPRVVETEPAALAKAQSFSAHNEQRWLDGLVCRLLLLPRDGWLHDPSIDGSSAETLAGPSKSSPGLSSRRKAGVVPAGKLAVVARKELPPSPPLICVEPEVCPPLLPRSRFISSDAAKADLPRTDQAVVVLHEEPDRSEVLRRELVTLQPQIWRLTEEVGRSAASPRNQTKPAERGTTQPAPTPSAPQAGTSQQAVSQPIEPPTADTATRQAVAVAAPQAPAGAPTVAPSPGVVMPSRYSDPPPVPDALTQTSTTAAPAQPFAAGATTSGPIPKSVGETVDSTTPEPTAEAAAFANALRPAVQVAPGPGKAKSGPFVPESGRLQTDAATGEPIAAPAAEGPVRAEFQFASPEAATAKGEAATASPIVLQAALVPVKADPNSTATAVDPTSDDVVEEQLVHAAACVGRQEFDAALKIYQDVLENSSWNPQALAGRARVYREQQRWEHALADSEALIRVLPQSNEGYLGRGAVRSMLGQPSAAIEDFSAVLARDPSLADVWNQRGKALLRCRQFDAALADFQKAIDLVPGMGRYYIERARAYRLLGQLPDAIDDYSVAIRLDEQGVDGLLERALTYLDQDQPRAALDDLNLALDRAPGDARLYAGRARVNRMQHAYDDALEDIAAALRLDAADPRIQAERAAILAERADK